MSTITHERLRELLAYDPESGDFTWKVRMAICVTKGMVAGRLNSARYNQVTINYRRYLAHRLAWFYVHGQWPVGQIDHINGIKTDNRIANLRDVSNSVNQHNRHTKPANATTGFTGVYIRRNGRFGARIKENHRLKYLGVYDTPEQAHAAYLAYRSQAYGVSPVAQDRLNP